MMQHSQSIVYTEGDLRFTVGQQVDFVVVVMDSITGVMRLETLQGEIVFVHAEPVTARGLNPKSPQGILAASIRPPAILSQGGFGRESLSATGNLGQMRVTGFEIALISVAPWPLDSVPEYYRPRFTAHQQAVCLCVPVRHVIQRSGEGAQGGNLERVQNQFFQRAPYGWNVLFHEPIEFTDRQNNSTRDEILDSRRRRWITRRITGQAVDFGVDHDNELKLIVNVAPNPEHLGPPMLDQFLFHGAFAEVARANSEKATLFKLPYRWVHDAYDPVHLGQQTYQSVLTHLLCDTLGRFRIKTLKYPKSASPDKDQSGSDQNGFYYGFTEEGLHFARSNRCFFNATTPSPRPLKETVPPGYEERSFLYTGWWLNLGKLCYGGGSNGGKGQHQKGHYRKECNQPNHLKRGYIIYGRVLNRPDKNQTTLEWCTPPPGLDLLRVYLATNGRSPIFHNMSEQELMDRLKDKDGRPTLASDLYCGLVDPGCSNPAADFVRRELIWSNTASNHLQSEELK